MTDRNQQIYDVCKDHMHAYVLIELVDGSSVDGIITGLDNESVYLAVPLEPHEQLQGGGSHHRQFGYGYPGYGGPGYGYGYGPGPRFRRLILPLTALAALSILPWY
ncbi:MULTISPECIES: hypothetical protein [Virgibacillus]|uniref:Uncharacterized protein n=2 Tax=Virgibacillus TaxID=84406 RepID=A0A024QEI6_9BACI|nr:MULTISPECIES: hypothetical protein [Virgibacillus]EQB35180.1 hypothetical protein M948_18955 [Virgibacillus sp. CM-4]MYL42764.1 hypothetical protein [Virgibacillus massiliensis]GGJ69250.1 hypothetical protein GCM10007111_33660 [Virgibacillus kapii]CDQ40657.1 hypothetical protein BN990_02984 [Virgibacillus massiliensis]